MIRAFTVLRGLVYSAAFVWLWTWLAMSVRPLDARLEVTLPGWLRPLGLVVASAGALGAGLAVSSLSIVLLALAFLLIMHLFVVVYEEPALAGKFGVSYQEYKASVHRWLIRKPEPARAPPF